MEAKRSVEDDLKELIGVLREREVLAWERADKRALWRIAFLKRAVEHAQKVGEAKQV